MTVYKLHAFVCNQIVTLVTNVTSKVQTSNNTMWIISKNIPYRGKHLLRKLVAQKSST